MGKPGIWEIISYAGSVASVGTALTLNDVTSIIGIATAVLTFAMNGLYAWRRDRREQRESDARLARMDDFS